MSDSIQPTQIQPNACPASRSAIVRVSGRFSRLFGGSTTFQSTGRFLRRQLWIWPLVAAIVITLAGWWVHTSVDDAMDENRAAVLDVILDADLAALKVWAAGQCTTAELICADERLRPLVEELLKAGEAKSEVERALLHSKAQAELRARLGGRLKQLGYTGFFLVNQAGVVLAAEQDLPVGKALGGYRQEFFTGVLKGHAAVSRPYASPLLLADEKGNLRANLPTMFAAASVADADGKRIAALGLRIRPDDQFTRILQVATFGKTGETYAFDKNGLMLSQSRFDEDLKEVGLLVDRPESQSILTVELRDPQANLMDRERPPKRRTQQPLTRMAAEATAGKNGHDVTGYRDYRGVPVVGAWRWLEDEGYGVATEVDVAEVFQPLYLLRRAFWVLMTLLALCSVGIYFATWYMARQQRALQQATLAARQLGQYTLEAKLGSGGMGTVYRGRHAMLRRPTAVKLLDIDKVSEAAITRFEREVQMTSGLTHPNTVAVFDYGRTPEGIFYYAMEYLEGVNLDDLVARYGALPEARAVYLLRQVCGSLAEAHATGLVHRDVKPANVFLTRRGGMHDFVKVLDFGLVKALEGEESAHVTSANAITGTPLYLSPEAVNQPDKVDARADVYAIGAVGYFLLTGTPVFSGASVMEICMKHVQQAPDRPSARCDRPISVELEAMLLRCLAKSPTDRPANAGELLRELDLCRVEGHWTTDDAAAWWANQDHSGVRAVPSPPTKAPTDVPTIHVPREAPLDATGEYVRNEPRTK